MINISRKFNTNNKSAGVNKKIYIVEHYTASGNIEQAIKTLTGQNGSKVSVHFIISRTGEIIQIGTPDDILWHAGESKYEGLTGLNKYSIGIENINWGILTKKGNKYYTWTNVEIPEEEIYIDSKGNIFHTYTHAQLEANLELCKYLVSKYPSIKKIVGHSDIAEGRKLDPSEAFPLKWLNEQCFPDKK